MTTKKQRCRHRRYWLYAVRGLAELLWCYECGAIREKEINAGWGPWTKPVGKGGENPALKLLEKKS